MSQTVQIARSEITRGRVVIETPPPLGDGEVRLRIESFSVTANNVTYAVAGDAFGYWNFFPAEDSWGVVPMWGHAVVEASNHPDVAAGERVYGYCRWPATSMCCPAGSAPGASATQRRIANR